ncbi:cobalt-zinc-cadmium resistance protein [Bordetella petrii]|nr:TolC family protein [Bordetella petrii]MBO1112177.1 TolC family protein [Bordetella petrii]MBO9354714.1 cobalt-zinc-cadmium resistance protein [Bordetella petrii]
MRLPRLPFLIAGVCLYALSASVLASSADPGAATNSNDVITLQEAIDKALTRNPMLSAARNEARAADGLITQAGVMPNPSLDVNVEDQRRATRTTTTMLNVPIELGGKRGARQQAARLAGDISQLDLEATRSSLRASVSAAFFEVAIAQENVRVARETRDIAQGALRVATARVESGKAVPLEKTRAEVELSNSGLAEQAALNTLANARRALALTWGESQPDFEGVAASLESLPPRPSLDELKASLDKSPLLASGRTALELSRAELEVEKSKRYPDITVSVGVARDNEMGRNRGQLGISIPLPLFDRNQGNVYAASMRSYKAQDVYRDLEARLNSSLIQAASKYDLAASSAQQYRNAVLPGAQRAYEAARKGFAAGKMSYLEVLDAQRALTQGNISYLTALSEAFLARAEIDRLIGY